MVRGNRNAYLVATLGLLGIAGWVIPSCGGSGNGKPSTTGSGGNSGSGGNGNPDGGGTGGKGNGTGGSGNGGTGGTIMPPASAKCAGPAADAMATALDFSNNLIASPSPPGNLTPAMAPQIVVFGWDDVESQEGITFVNGLYGTLNNPDNTKAKCNLNPNACYGEGGAPPVGKYTCGSGTLSFAKDMLTLPSYDMGNHTIDHLEGFEALGGWSMIPPAWKDTVNGGWKFTDDGMGPGIGMDQATWNLVLGANDTELKSLYGAGKTITIAGLRAPRLEINDNGLKAVKAYGYNYDQDLEEILPEQYTTAAIAVDTPNKKGFNWVPWPYTLDNGSPGIWNQQASNDKKYIVDYPLGLWEIPVYQVYLPTAGGLGTAVAASMLKSDAPTNCTFPPGTAADAQKHCYLAEGELSPGEAVQEVTAFDFNTFIYSRMTPDQWLAIMKHTFLMRYYGNRAPLTYGAHPVEYTAPYDSYTIAVQANNYGYRDVVKYSTYLTRQMAMQSFISWIKSDATLSKDTFFLSAAQLAAYMTAPFDKTGAKVAADTVATPDSNGVFKRLTWTGKGATINATDGNTADITFNVTTPEIPVSVTAGVAAGSLKNLSHIDIKYTTDVPFRVRLITNDGSVSTTVLLAGVGGARTARLRVKDFSPGVEVLSDKVASAALVGSDYMNKVAGIAIESAATPITGGGKAFTTHIDQLTLHGADTTALCTP